MWKYRKIDTTSNDVSNVQLIPNPYKMEYAVYNLTSNSIELCTIDIHSSKYGELKLDWDTIVNILDDGIRFKSSLHEGGVNVVLFDSSCAECVSVKTVEIKHVTIGL